MSQRGSALILAVFLLAILAGLVMALHFQALTELTMSSADWSRILKKLASWTTR